MRRFGETLLHTYLFIALFNGVIGLTEILSQLLNWEQAWFSAFVGIFALVWFLATFFFVALFRNYRIPHVYYILPLFYIISYSSLSGLALVFSFKGFSWAWIPLFFLSATFLSSSFETVFAGAQLGKISALKKNVKKGKKNLSL
ncbi:hypothetical protein CL619_03115 [archaeon]|nr:hypothetical protein [archaeon]|tara:strand:- start:3681 stop:4112 length:432 start_codon:yes stop_codon:yes gene_type:complete